MAQHCFLCKKKCKYNSASFQSSRESNCKKAKEIKKICNACSYESNCERNPKGYCAQHRKNEIAGMHLKADEKILRYLEYIYFDHCPNKSINLMDLATEMAQESWYEGCHSSTDWEYFAKEEGIKKSEKEFIEQDLAPQFIKKAEKIIKVKELENPSLTLSNTKDRTDDCVNCPPKFKNGCFKESLPESWIGFPDLYIQEALKRKIIGDFIQR